MKDNEKDKIYKEVELELSVVELERFAHYCHQHNIKFNDWIRSLAHQAIDREKRKA